MATRGGIRAERGGSSRRRGSKLPRLARWAGVGVFVFLPTVVNCGDDEENNKPEEEGFVYVGTMRGQTDQIHKFKATTGEKVLALGGEHYGPLSLDIDRATGDVFVYTPHYLRKYSKNREQLFRVYIREGNFYDKMVYDAGTGDAWVCLSYFGQLARYSGKNGELKSRFDIGVKVIDQLIYDETADLFWIVIAGGYSVMKYLREGEKLIEIKDDGELTPMAIDRKTDTILVGFYSRQTRSNSVRRYDKEGLNIDEFPTTLSPTRKTHGIGVEAGTGRIWVSDDQKTEIYDGSGQLVNVLTGKGFVVMDFDNNGDLMFGITADAEVYAIRTADLKVLWSTKTSNPRKDFSAVKYSRQ
jgi:DNA-binding beta-propeller fold protein YncE